MENRNINEALNGKYRRLMKMIHSSFYLDVSTGLHIIIWSFC